MVKPTETWIDFYTNGPVALSYFAGICASENRPHTMLLGDRNISGLGMFSECTNSGMMIGRSIQITSEWSEEMHNRSGNIAFADGSAEQMTTTKLQKQAATPPNGTTCTESHVLAPCPNCGFTQP
jgi:prepilin-type processing-associated H-X9-DG protein